MNKKHPITIAYGDGIGPEIMKATLHVLKEAGAQIETEEIVIGEKAYHAGYKTGIADSAWESLIKTKVFLKAPITTPLGGGFVSLNVTVRTTLGLYANVRPCTSYHPFVETKHPKMDVVVIRENEEDLYTGIEYRQTPDVCTATKLISRPGSEKIIRYAFEYARSFGRKKVTCFTKDNILKITDGIFHKIFEEISKEYTDIENDHWIVDIGAAKLATTPEDFDVLVLPNLYGDILSDVAGQITGSIGLIGTANIGEKGAMFEAIHGSAPKRGGQNVANPSALLLSSVLMLVHIHQNDTATLIHNAWLRTIEEGIHTYDIYKEGVSKKRVGTKEFAEEVAKRLGQKPEKLKSVDYSIHGKQLGTSHHGTSVIATKRELVGVDIYVYSHDAVETLAQKCQEMNTPSLALSMIANRGVVLWPKGFKETNCVDQWRCRYLGINSIQSHTIASLIHRFAAAGIEVIRTENLYNFDDKPGYSHAQQ